MTLRDQFAAAALTGLLTQGDYDRNSLDAFVKSSYCIADAMLAYRKEKSEAVKEREKSPCCGATVAYGNSLSFPFTWKTCNGCGKEIKDKRRSLDN